MQKYLLLLSLLFFATGIRAQQPDSAEKLVTEGVAQEDSGRSNKAISLYKQALDLDHNNLDALAEMAYSLLSSKKYDESIQYCKQAIETHSGDNKLKTVYVTFGTAYDDLKQPDKSIEVYNQGIKLFPDFYHLYFNKGITLLGINKVDAAMDCFEKSAMLNPNHPGTQNAIGHTCLQQNKMMPSLMAYFRLIAVEPGSVRSKAALEEINKMISSAATKTDDKHITVSINPAMLSTGGKKNQPDNFSDVELILTLASALDFDSSTIGRQEVVKLLNKINTICDGLKETKSGNSGFFWTYYAPYLIEMKDKGFTDTFAYIAYAPENIPAVNAWLQLHADDVNSFLKWSQGYSFTQMK